MEVYRNLQNGEIHKQLISPIIREKSVDMDEKSDRNEHDEDAHKKQNQAKVITYIYERKNKINRDVSYIIIYICI
jgi:hypothetical protein